MSEFFTTDALSALLQVIMIDLVLAGDNAIVIGLAAAGLPKEQRAKAILIGIIVATVLRIGFAAATTQLLQIVGLLLAGGILLLWICWKMWRELRTSHAEEIQGEEALDAILTKTARLREPHRTKHSRRRPGKLSLPMCRCRSTTYWQWQAPQESTPTC
jgi:predicted tellurium resistance membrane protein TerC